MPTLRFLIFKQVLFEKFLAHWALFIPNKEGGGQGVLFEVKKWKSKRTHFWHRDFNDREAAKYIRANIPIPEINVKPPEMNRVCHTVNKNRPFHLLNSNCQHWVFEVMERLIRDKGIRDGVEIFRRIEMAGYKPLRGYTLRLLEGEDEQEE